MRRTYQFVHIVVWTVFIINEWFIITKNIKTKPRRWRIIVEQNTCKQLSCFTYNIRGNSHHITSRLIV